MPLSSPIRATPSGSRHGRLGPCHSLIDQIAARDRGQDRDQRRRLRPGLVRRAPAAGPVSASCARPGRTRICAASPARCAAGCSSPMSGRRPGRPPAGQLPPLRRSAACCSCITARSAAGRRASAGRGDDSGCALPARDRDDRSARPYSSPRSARARADPVQALEAILAEVRRSCARPTSARRSRFAATVTDGDTLWAFRWSSDARPPTLYYEAQPGGCCWSPSRSTARVAVAGSAAGARGLPPQARVAVTCAGAELPLGRLARLAPPHLQSGGQRGIRRALPAGAVASAPAMPDFGPIQP